MGTLCRVGKIAHGVCATSTSSSSDLPTRASQPLGVRVGERAQERADMALSRRVCPPYSLQHDPEKWEPVFGERSCSNKEVERDDDSTKNHPALAGQPPIGYRHVHAGSRLR